MIRKVVLPNVCYVLLTIGYIVFMFMVLVPQMDLQHSKGDAFVVMMGVLVGFYGVTTPIARYFLPGTACTWYVLEDDSFFADEAKTQPSEDMIVFGAATLGYGLELGSISLKDVFAARGQFGLRAERDISVKPLKETLGTLRKRYCEDWH